MIKIRYNGWIASAVGMFLAFGVILFAFQSDGMPGQSLSNTELDSIWGAGLPGTKCSDSGVACTTSGNTVCALADSGIACDVTLGSCGICTGPNDERCVFCSFGGLFCGTCTQFPLPCCALHTCKYHTAAVGAPAHCHCDGPVGAAAGTLTGC